jgi:hypothetical protein
MTRVRTSATATLAPRTPRNDCALNPFADRQRFEKPIGTAPGQALLLARRYRLSPEKKCASRTHKNPMRFAKPLYAGSNPVLTSDKRRFSLSRRCSFGLQRRQPDCRNCCGGAGSHWLAKVEVDGAPPARARGGPPAAGGRERPAAGGVDGPSARVIVSAFGEVVSALRARP